MVIDVCVCKDTLDKIDNSLRIFQIKILEDIGKNYLDKKDQKELRDWYSGNLMLEMVDIVKMDILYDIGRNYGDDTLTGDILIEEFIHL